jgi:phosphomevalonate kinase
VKVIAPGKLVLTGAYAVLEGAPAIVAAVDRYAIAEVGAPPQPVDVRALHDAQGRKLGLGSSAASMVAALGARALAGGEDPRRPTVRTEIFREARAAHAREQGGGSGVDVAAAVYGGTLRYVLAGTGAKVQPVELPDGVELRAFWSGTSARTSDLLARTNALRARDPKAGVFTALRERAMRAADALEAGEAQAFVDAASDFGRSLAKLGEAADAPIVPPAFADLAADARSERAAFLPSGAGGGDVAVWLGVAPPPASFVRRAETLGLVALDLALDRGGVRPHSLS